MLLADRAGIVHPVHVGHLQHIPAEVAAAQYPEVLFNSFDVMPGRPGTADSSPAIEVPPPPEDDLAAVFSLASQMRALIQETLASGTAEGWEDAFFKKVRTYETFSRALGELLTRVDLPGALRRRNKEKAEKALLQRFPEAIGEIRFITSIVEDAAEHASGFSSMPVADDLRAEDHENASSFSAYGAVFNMCLSTLYYIAWLAPSTSDEVVKAALELARHAALGFNHASMEGARLREGPAESDDQPAGLIERAYPDDDDLEHVEELIRRSERGPGQALA